MKMKSMRFSKMAYPFGDCKRLNRFVARKRTIRIRDLRQVLKMNQWELIFFRLHFIIARSFIFLKVTATGVTKPVW